MPPPPWLRGHPCRSGARSSGQRISEPDLLGAGGPPQKRVVVAGAGKVEGAVTGGARGRVRNRVRADGPAARAPARSGVEALAGRAGPAAVTALDGAAARGRVR